MLCLIGQWVKVWHAWPEMNWIKAANCFRDSDFRKAAKLYQLGLLAHAHHVAARCATLDLSYCQYKLGNLGEAIKLLTELTHQKPYLREAFLLLVKCLRCRSEDIDAYHTARAALRLFPGDLAIGAQYLFCCVVPQIELANRGEVQQLIDSLMYGQAEQDGLKDVVTAHSYYEYKYGDRAEALSTLSRLLASGVPPYEAVLLRALIFEDEGRNEQARFHYTRAMKRCPEDYRPLLGLARTYYADGEFRYASELARAACTAAQWHSVDCIKLLVKSLTKTGASEGVELFQAKQAFLETKQNVMYSKLGVGSSHGYFKIVG